MRVRVRVRVSNPNPNPNPGPDQAAAEARSGLRWLQEGAEGWEAAAAECVAQGTPLALELAPRSGELAPRSSELHPATRALLATGRVPLPPAATPAPAAGRATRNASAANKASAASKAGKGGKAGRGGGGSELGKAGAAQVILDGAACTVHPAFRLYAFSDAPAPAGVPAEALGAARVIDARLGATELAARVCRMVRARTEPAALAAQAALHLPISLYISLYLPVSPYTSLYLAAQAAARRELVHGQDALEARSP